VRSIVAIAWLAVAGCDHAPAPSHQIPHNASPEKPMSHTSKLAEKLVDDA